MKLRLVNIAEHSPTLTRPVARSMSATQTPHWRARRCCLSRLAAYEGQAQVQLSLFPVFLPALIRQRTLIPSHLHLSAICNICQQTWPLEVSSPRLPTPSPPRNFLSSPTSVPPLTHGTRKQSTDSKRSQILWLVSLPHSQVWNTVSASKLAQKVLATFTAKMTKISNGKMISAA